MTSTIGPDYRKVIDLIRDKITSGKWPVGQPIPSTTDLRELTGLSITSVRRGVEQLQADGVLEGHPGKGVYVRATPGEAARGKADIGMLSAEVRDLGEKVGEYDDLRERVGKLETILIDWAARQGFENPFGGAADDPPRKASGHGRRGR